MAKEEQDKEDAESKAEIEGGKPDAGQETGGQETLSDLCDRMLRLQAEFDNYKKRTAKEKEQLVHSAEGRLMKRMLPVYEEIGLAEKEAGKLHDESLKKGILLVLSKLRSSFEKEGLQEMRLDGEKADPFRHEIAMKEESDKPEGAIVRVIQKGYLFRGEVLRHAVVSVSGGKKQEEKNDWGSAADAEKADAKESGGEK
jgi:molecular chaperone GrpE